MIWFQALTSAWACAIILSIASVCCVHHGKFASITITSGLSSIPVENIPMGSRFIIYQLHSPYNPILASTLPGFDYDAHQFSSHIGLASLIYRNTSSSQLYVYSPYEVNVTAWFIANAYTADYPLPGGCKISKAGETSIASVSSVVPNTVQSSLSASALLNYWTSSINFVAAAKFSVSSGSPECMLTHTVRDPKSIIYHVYASSLVTSGGSYGAYDNPNPMEAAKVIKRMTFTDDSFAGKHFYSSFQRTPIIDQNFVAHLSVARRPCTAVVVTVVAEYLGSFKVPYVPVIVFGCPNPPIKVDNYRAVFKENASAFLNCAVLPQNNPTIYLPIAILLLASLCYSASLHYWIWPRCAVSVMLIASVLGMIFFCRYSQDISDTPTALVASAILPALVALSVFLILWCHCIRPTLQYQRVFGRGPLMKVANPTESHYREPWNDELLATTVFQSPDLTSGETVIQNPTSSLNALGTLPPVTEEEPRLTVEHDCLSIGSETSLTKLTYGSFKPPEYIHIFGIRIFRKPRWFSSSSQNFSRPTALFSLRPRRIARLPPILPATFVFVAFLSISFDRSLSLNQSTTPFVLFTLIMSCLLLVFLCIFKNFAFGLSTASVGLYIALSCVCLFLLPGALLPHIVIEYFLMVTWMEKRLPVLRISFYGLYDVILLVSWFFVSIVLGLMTLCLVRLQDARELAEAQHWYTMQFGSHVDQPVQTNSMSLMLPVQTEKSGFFSFIPRIVQVPFMRTASSTSVMANVSNISLGQASCEAAEYQTSGNAENLVATSSSRSGTEKQPLLHGRLGSTYGGLASTTRPPLMPLSRVQLAAAGGLSSRLTGQPVMSSLPTERMPSSRNLVASTQVSQNLQNS